MKIIDQFLHKYQKNLRYYALLADYCQAECQRLLRQNGIKCIVSSRAKTVESIQKKILKRNKLKKYTSVEQIQNDIKDKAGVRIGLFFPSDCTEVEKIIKSAFNLTQQPARFECNRLKYDDRFAGYRAIHYKVKLKQKKINNTTIYDGEVIEIQVASILMLSWAEIEHDIAYKQPENGVSQSELALLAQLNGLIHSSEITLEQLKSALNNRLDDKDHTFLNHYELSSFILNNLPDDVKNMISTPTLGRSDLLFTLLKKLDKNNPEFIKKYILDFENKFKNEPICDQIIKLIALENKTNYEAYYNMINHSENIMNNTP